MKTLKTFREALEQREEHEYRLCAALLGRLPFTSPFTPITETRRPEPAPPTERQRQNLLEALGVRQMEPTATDRLCRALGGR